MRSANARSMSVSEGRSAPAPTPVFATSHPATNISTIRTATPASSANFFIRRTLAQTGERDLEDGAAVVPGRNRAAVTLDDRLDDGQPEPAAAGRAPRRVRLVEAVEDEREVLRED